MVIVVRSRIKKQTGSVALVGKTGGAIRACLPVGRFALIFFSQPPITVAYFDQEKK